MLLIFVPEIVGHDQDDSKPEGTISSAGGNLIALSTGILLAVNISIMRKGFQQDINLIGTTPLAGIFGCLIVLAVQTGDVLPESIHWPRPWQFWMAVMVDGMAVGVVYAAITVGPRLANGAEVALVVLLEVILGPLWVFAAYGDLPPIWTLVGGAM
jgi:drug/metabolite transporter (DMT)-like permease